MTNSSSQLFTLSNKKDLHSERLVFFTGKGGVGKTLLSLAYANSLNKLGKKVKYVSFKDAPPQKLIQQLGIPHFNLQLHSSTLVYLELKLKSKQIAKWIASSSFFQSIFQLLPSLEDMILLGHLIYELKSDPDLIYVIDTPSSGHAFSLFESLDLWKKIFISGPLIDDIKVMKSFLQDKDKTVVYISSLMTELSLQEANELQSFTHKLNLKSDIIFNDVYARNCVITNSDEDLPRFLKHRIKFENDILEKEKCPFVPHFFYDNSADIVKSISSEALEK